MKLDNNKWNIRRLSIRPKLHKGESLTSFLMRLSTYNSVRYHYLIYFLQKQTNKALFYRRQSRVDTLPEQTFDLEKLVILSNQKAEIILTNSFTYLANKLEAELNYSSEKYLNLINHLVKGDKRYFCEKCIEEKKGYKLLWQVKGIDYCLEHRRKLIRNCLNCGNEQAYIHGNLGEYLCSECACTLWKHSKEYEEDFNFEEQNYRYKTWEYLLRPNSKMVPLVLESDNEKSLSIALIYAVQSSLSKYKPNKYNYSLVKKVLRDDYLHSLIRHINDSSNPQTVTLRMLIKTLEKIKMTIWDFSKLGVPQEYIESLITENYLKECLTPWCAGNGNNQSLKNVQNSKYLHYKNSKYKDVCVCTYCNVQYGFNISSNQWKEYGDFVEKIEKVCLMIKEGKKIKMITNELGIKHSNYYKFIGYILRYNMLPYELSKKLLNKITNRDNIVECFKTLFYAPPFNRSSIAKKIYGWSEMEYYYFFYNQEIQSIYWTLIRNKKSNIYKTVDKDVEFLQKIELSLQESIENEVQISFKQVAASIAVKKSVFHGTEVAQKIKKQKRIQNKEMKEKSELELFDRAQSFIDTKNSKNEVVYCKDVYKYLGKSSNNIKGNMPNLACWISQKSIESKNKHRVDKIQALNKQAQNIIHDARKSGEITPNKTKIIEMLGIKSKGYNKYREVISEIEKLLDNKNY